MALIEKRLLTVKECAKYVGSTAWTIYSWVAKKKIPYVKLGKNVRFDVLELDNWINEKSIKYKQSTTERLARLFRQLKPRR